MDPIRCLEILRRDAGNSDQSFSVIPPYFLTLTPKKACIGAVAVLAMELESKVDYVAKGFGIRFPKILMKGCSVYFDARQVFQQPNYSLEAQKTAKFIKTHLGLFDCPANFCQFVQKGASLVSQTAQKSLEKDSIIPSLQLVIDLSLSFLSLIPSLRDCSKFLYEINVIDMKFIRERTEQWGDVSAIAFFVCKIIKTISDQNKALKSLTEQKDQLWKLERNQNVSETLLRNLQETTKRLQNLRRSMGSLEDSLSSLFKDLNLVFEGFKKNSDQLAQLQKKKGEAKKEKSEAKTKISELIRQQDEQCALQTSQEERLSNIKHEIDILEERLAKCKLEALSRVMSSQEKNEVEGRSRANSTLSEGSSAASEGEDHEVEHPPLAGSASNGSSASTGTRIVRPQSNIENLSVVVTEPTTFRGSQPPSGDSGVGFSTQTTPTNQNEMNDLTRKIEEYKRALETERNLKETLDQSIRNTQKEISKWSEQFGTIDENLENIRKQIAEKKLLLIESKEKAKGLVREMQKSKDVLLQHNTLLELERKSILKERVALLEEQKERLVKRISLLEKQTSKDYFVCNVAKDATSLVGSLLNLECTKKAYPELEFARFALSTLSSFVNVPVTLFVDYHKETYLSNK